MADGGYFPRSWGWSTIALCAAAGMALLLRSRIAVGRLDLVALGAITAFAAWTALSMLWSDLPHESRLDAERALVYVAGLGALLLVAGRSSAPRLLGGVLAAATAVSAYALLDRAVSGKRVDPYESMLLFRPIGYANALGILAAMGILLALGLSLRSRGLARGLAAAPIAVLAPTLYLTDSRGAWIALGCGVAALAAAELGRLPVVAAALAVATAAGLVAVVARAAHIPGDRAEYWRVAWHEYVLNPWLGSGARTFHLYWLLYRPIPVNVRDAHSLYLETLAELGPAGLALLLAALAVPLVAAARAHTNPFVPAAAGAYTAFLVHAAQDWDWEMPAVTLAALACGAALLAAARPERARALSPPAQIGVGVVFVAVAALALAGILENA